MVGSVVVGSVVVGSVVVGSVAAGSDGSGLTGAGVLVLSAASLPVFESFSFAATAGGAFEDSV